MALFPGWKLSGRRCLMTLDVLVERLVEVRKRKLVVS